MVDLKRTFTSSVDNPEVESFAFPEEDVLEGQPNARVHWLRPEGHGSQAAGVYRCDPAVFRYAWEADETIHVLEGRVRIEVEGADSLELGVGDIASFTAGDRGVWHVLEPFCELFVLST
ncbi:MAG TPA: cupin domain-containing protein [Solirubrobacteraceae bacterium]|nr:cupin domain-containing protein [Solirubrobacteraceae bacterium]